MSLVESLTHHHPSNNELLALFGITLTIGVLLVLSWCTELAERKEDDE